MVAQGKGLSMERHCPICGHVLGRHELVCILCRERIDAREPRRRAGALYAWGRGLMLFLAIFLFLKGAYATLSPEGYKAFVADMGFPMRDDHVLHWNAAFALVAALLYAVAWVGGYLGRPWDALVCLAALAAFVVGQGLAQFVLCDQGGVARALALFVFWCSVPVFQYYSFILGRGRVEPPSDAGTDEQAEEPQAGDALEP